MRRWSLYAVLCGVFVFPFANSAVAGDTVLATVQVNEPSEYRDWAELAQLADVATGTGPTSFWRTIPSFVDSTDLDFSFLLGDTNKPDAIAYGKLDFTVQSDGPVWMLTTTRFGGGGDSTGNWLPEVSYQEDLEVAGWAVIASGVGSEFGYGPAGTNSGLLDWLLFERVSMTGEAFSIRTEKYQSPIILQGVGSIPEPAAGLGAPILMATVALRRRRLRTV